MGNQGPVEIERVKEELFNIVTDPPCHGEEYCEFWDRQGHYCFLGDMHKDTVKCKLLDQILSIKGICIKADDQSLPENPIGKEDQFYHIRLSYHKAQQDMLKAGFIKVVEL